MVIWQGFYQMSYRSTCEPFTFMILSGNSHKYHLNQKELLTAHKYHLQELAKCYPYLIHHYSRRLQTGSPRATCRPEMCFYLPWTLFNFLNLCCQLRRNSEISVKKSWFPASNGSMKPGPRRASALHPGVPSFSCSSQLAFFLWSTWNSVCDECQSHHPTPKWHGLSCN